MPAIEEEVVMEAVPEEPKDKEDDYLPCNQYRNRKVNDKVNNVALFRNKKSKLFYFALYDEKKNVKLRSEGFRTSQERDKELSGVLRYNKNPDRYERVEKGDYYMDILRDENGTEVGRSCLKKEEENAGVLVAAGLGAAGLGLVGIGDTPVVEKVAVVEKEVVAAVPVVPVVPIPEPPKTIVDTSTYDDTETVAAAGVGGAAVAGGGAGCMKYLPWLLLLALLLLLLLWLLKGCDGCGGAVDTNVIPPATTETVPDADANANAAEEVEAIPEAYEALGPNAKKLGFAKGSVVAMMADCMADPNCTIPSEKFTLSIVHFGENDAHMNKAAYAEMDDLAKLMKAYPNMNIDIHGHIDDQESDVYDGRYQDGNITLSGIRARCVYRKLTDRGISGSRMKFTGHAATQLVTTSNSDTDNIKNRRVEVVISKR
jgi:outer membrane protein OmpA-like peptidoglycan-associated protein